MKSNCRAAIALITILGALSCFQLANCKHFTVKVADKSRLNEVADTLREKGFFVKHVNKRFSFISVQEIDKADIATAAAVEAGASYPGTSDASPCAVTGDTDANATVYASGSDAKACAKGGIQPTFTAPRPAEETVSSAAAVLSLDIPGVTIEVDPLLHLTRRLQASKQQQPSATPSQDTAACPQGGDGLIGRTQEDVPYGIKMVQATEPEMIEVSKDFKSKVMFCVIDTGLDKTNFEFNADSTSGCTPKTTRASGANTTCLFPWYRDWSRHGTHTSGTIGAARNGKGVVGVSAEGAQLYHFNGFGPTGGFAMSELVGAVQECLAELDERKAATNTPDMKLIVSMSFGTEADFPLVRAAIKELTAERAADLLLLAAAGNGHEEGAVFSYPASWPDVVSIAAVDWNGERADFSQVNNQVDWAAPGVQTLSTVPVHGSALSSYNTMPSVSLAAADGSFLSSPTPNVLGGVKPGAVSGQLVDCGLAKAPCADATGKICLIQRGENPFCEKAANCIAGGGVGILIYGREDQDDCESFEGTLDGGCKAPAKGWPVGLTITKAQGKALQGLIAADASLSVTLDCRKSPDPLPLDFMSGTSMATPTAAGVAGLVWSAHTACSSSELRAAISASAADLGSPGYDEEYGYGLVQAAAAHKYLQEHPCSGGEAQEPPKRQRQQVALRQLSLKSNLPEGVEAVVGDVIEFTATVTASGPGQKVDGIIVRLHVQPTARALECADTRLVTAADGTAKTTCKVKAVGVVAVEARMGAGEKLVTAQSNIVSSRRRSVAP